MHPLVRLGIYEDLRQRLRSRSTPYACLVAVVLPLETSTAHPPLRQPNPIAGTVEIGVRNSVWFASVGQHVYLSNLAIEASYRRQRVALHLLKQCEKIALEWGYSAAYLHVMEDNEAARCLYEKAGYQLYQTEPSIGSLLLGRPRQLMLRKGLQTK